MRLLYGATACALLMSLFSLGWDTKAEPRVYQGTWNTTNRKLDGTMTCVVTELPDQKWNGRFYGVWQRVPFDYTVTFSGSPEKLRGTAIIDGADYQWEGAMSDKSPSRFTGSFGGSRYTGYFDLQEKQRPAAGERQEPSFRLDGTSVESGDAR
jgi:hypothetical protein